MSIKIINFKNLKINMFKKKTFKNNSSLTKKRLNTSSFEFCLKGKKNLRHKAQKVKKID